MTVAYPKGSLSRVSGGGLGRGPTLQMFFTSAGIS